MPANPRPRIPTPSPSLLVALAALVVASAGAAAAAIPDARGVIHGCYSEKSGQLRVVDVRAGEACDKKELPLDWNQRGPAGPPGPPGPSGVTNLVVGDAGPIVFGSQGESLRSVAQCEPGERATGGGYEQDGVDVKKSYAGTIAFQTPTSWEAVGEVRSPGGGFLRAWVMCASP
jgi:hypothetical protein